MKSNDKSKTEKSRLQLLHQYYKYTGFYTFVWQGIKRTLPIILLFIAAILVVDYFFDINASLVKMTEILPVTGVLSFFFLSETILGLIPPEIFIAWTGKLNQPWLFLGVLALLSYVGGLIAYWFGVYMTRMPSVHRYLEDKLSKHLKNSKKWGGFLILVGAILPLPFSMACLAAGLIRFPFKHVMLYGSMRFVRFAIYGYIIFSAL